MCEIVYTEACPTMVVTGAALNFRDWPNCTYISGDLLIYRTNESITEESLAFLQTVEVVLGDVVVQDNPGIFSLSFLKKLHRSNRLIVRDNLQLFCATVPKLHSTVNVIVENCPALCPLRYPIAMTFGDLECKIPQLLFQSNQTLPQPLPTWVSGGCETTIFFVMLLFIVCLFACLFVYLLICSFDWLWTSLSLVILIHGQVETVSASVQGTSFTVSTDQNATLARSMILRALALGSSVSYAGITQGRFSRDVK